MSAKFLHAFTDDSPELQKQIGCMTGIFQMFDRHHVVTGRRLSGHNHKRPPSGRALTNSSSLGAEHTTGSPQIVLERNVSKSLSEKQRISMESSRTSFSSSSRSSFSSVDCNKSTQQDPLSFNRTIFLDNSLRNSPRLKTSNPHSELPPASPQSGRHRSLDFLDVVKNSINRDSRGLSVKTSPKGGVNNNHLQYQQDSPRPMLLSKSMDGSYMIGINGKSRAPADLKESLRVLVKLKEAPWNISEVGELPRSSSESKGASFHSVSRGVPRFSFDGREISRQSLDSRENSKPASKLQDIPRLSLDSREGSLRGSNFDSKPNLKHLDRSNINTRVSKAKNVEQELASDKRPPNVVAKLMGLEAMPSLRSVATQEPNKGSDPSSKAYQESKQDRLSCSPKISVKDDVTPCIKKPDSVMKPISSSKVPIETAPWRQQEKLRFPYRTTFVQREANPKQQHKSVYSEIEKRLKELEFRQSNKDLRALKQILDAMQAKGLLESKKGDPTPAEYHQNLRPEHVQTPKTMKGSSSPRAFESPIVIMKPASSVNRSVAPSSAIPLEGLSGLRRLRTSDVVDRKKASINNKTAKDQTPKASPRAVSTGRRTNSRTEENGPQKAQSRMIQVSSRPRQSSRENSGSSLKTVNSLSPRLQQRKLETERSSRPPIASPDSSKAQRPGANRQPLESISPRGKLRRKPAQVQEYDQLSESSERRTPCHLGDEISQRSDSNISLASQVDIEVTSTDRSADVNSAFFQQGTQSPSSGRAARKAISGLEQKRSTVSLNDDVSNIEVATVAPEQPSPVSVLDASFYHDDLSPSPVKKSFNAAKDNKTPTSDDCWNLGALPDSPTTKFDSEISHKKLQNIENLVLKLSELSSTGKEPNTTDHIATLCETQNPDNRYVSEILLASGLLLKDLSSGPIGPMSIELHPSGHAINPDLFLVLEQTKAGCPWKPETINETTFQSMPDPEKLHRKLVFDVVNEVLIQKFELTSSGRQPDRLVRSRKFTGRFSSGQRLLKEVCSEIEQLGAEISRRENSDDEISILDGEVLRQSEGWEDFGREMPGVVLEIERSIFKDLIDEVVSGEAVAGLQHKSSRRRQLFAK